MMKIPLIVFAPLLLISCATLMPEMVPAPEVVHEHKLTITDLKGNPLAGAKVSFLEKNNDEVVLNSTTTTAADGVVVVKINATSDRKYPSILAYKTTVNYNVEKEGFYKASAFTFVAKSGQKSESIPLVQSDTKTLKLIKPTDFFSENYLASVQSGELKVKILSFIDVIRAEGFLADSDLEPYSIALSSFKGKNYLTFRFKNTNVFNSLKLNKYEIGKRLFDDVVRKVLNPLNSYISSPQAFYGYDVTVLGFTKDFSDKYAANKTLEYRFLMPAGTVNKYKDKEITGQGLIDASVVLLDDERIDMRLQ